MIHAITGKPGGGKSLHAVRLIVERLRETPFNIVTNLPLNVGELNAFVPDANVCARVRLLQESEVTHFWRYRGHVLEGGVMGPEVIGEPQPDFSVRYSRVFPVVYVIDEAHVFFNAREWAKMGKEALWYLSQHRHLGDTVIWISQFPGNVDKQFRVLTQDFTLCRNWAFERMAGFAMPKRFRLEVSLESPEHVNRTIMETRTFRPDLRLFALYDTTAGAGLPGGLKPEPPPRRRPSVFIGFLGLVVVLGAAGYFLPKLVMKGIGAASTAALRELPRADASSVSNSPTALHSPDFRPSRKGEDVGSLSGEPPQSSASGPSMRLTAHWMLPDGRAFVAWESPSHAKIWDGRKFQEIPKR